MPPDRSIDRARKQRNSIDICRQYQLFGRPLPAVPANAWAVASHASASAPTMISAVSPRWMRWVTRRAKSEVARDPLGRVRRAQRHQFGRPPSGRMFRHANGQPVRPDWLTRRCATLVKQLELPQPASTQSQILYGSRPARHADLTVVA
jgi:hypothetical protein